MVIAVIFALIGVAQRFECPPEEFFTGAFEPFAYCEKMFETSNMRAISFDRMPRN